MRRPSIFAALAAILIGVAPGSGQQQGVTKYLRYSHEGKEAIGILEGETIHELWGDDILAQPPRTGKTVPLSQVRILVPVRPEKIYGFGLNYASHLGDTPPPENPSIFWKPPTALAAHDEPIVYRPGFTDLHYEAEVVVVIGRDGKDIPLEDAGDYIFGLTAGNDISERAWQSSDRHYPRAKGSDQFGPIGPYVVTGLDYTDLDIQSRLNGELKQSANTHDLITGIHEAIAYLSTFSTLKRGDLIFTGTSGTTSAMVPGDVIEIYLEGVGTLRNRIVAP